MQVSLGEQFRTVFGEMAQDLVSWTPRILIGFTLIVLALIGAKLLERLLALALSRLNFDGLLERLGLDNGLRRLGVRQPASRFIPRLFFYVLLFLLARTAADSLGLTAISDTIGTLIGYLPNVIAALIVVLVGGAMAQWVGNAVTSATEDAALPYARSLGRFAAGLVLFVMAVMVLNQLEIETATIRLFSAALLGGLVLAVGLSFGLGSREITRNILAGFYARQLFRVGDSVEIRGEAGTLAAMTPTQILISKDNENVALANSVFLDDMARKRP